MAERESELLRNGSGYVDPTAYKALKKIEKMEDENMNEFKPGEIWESVPMDGRKPIEYFLIITVQKRYCNVLKLTYMDAEKAEEYGRTKVLARCEMYVDAGMLSYAFNDRLTGFIRTLTEEEFKAIRTQVIAKLGFEHGFKSAYISVGVSEKRVAELEAELEKLKEDHNLEMEAYNNNIRIAYDSVSDLEGKLEEAQKERDGLMHEVDRLNAELMLQSDGSEENVKLQVERDFYKEQYEKLFGMVTKNALAV